MSTVSSKTATGTSVLDVNLLVSSLMSVENQALTKIDSKISAANTRISSFGSFISKAGNLRSALDGLADPAAFTSRSATSSAPALLGATATAGASPGTLDVQVRQTAQAQRSIISGFASADALLGAGTLTLTSPATGKTTTLQTTATTTLADLATRLNAANAGVSASVVQKGDGDWMLLVTGQAVGQAQRFTLGFADAAGAAIGTTATPQAALDAEVRVAGVTYTRGSNTLANVLPGVTLELKEPVSAASWDAASTARVTVAGGSSAATSAVQKLVTAYNETWSLYQSLTRASADSALRGPLSGNGTLTAFMGRVRSAIFAGFTDATGRSMGALSAGLKTQQDGTLQIDSAKLQTALDGTLGAMLGSGLLIGGTGGDLRTLVGNALKPGGMLASTREGAQSEIKLLQSRRSQVSDRLATTETRYRRQYSTLDAQLTTMQQTSSSLASALDVLSRTTDPNN